MQEIIHNKIYTNSGNINVLNEIPASAKKILDIGCGAGDNSRILFAAQKIVDGITISEEEAKIAAEFQRSTYIYNLENGLPIEITDTYDAVICAHVLEHICYPQNVLRDTHARMSDDAVLIIALPNIMHYKTRLKLIKGNFQYTDSGIMDYTHFRWYTFKSAQTMLEENGFEVVKAFVNSNKSNSAALSWMPERLVNGLKSIAFGISKGLFGIELLYVAKKKK
jgi:2-polyprenyl-3-methyl-5-hydroxy-6-metoxy-1,4-benzoquinol methylase